MSHNQSSYLDYLDKEMTIMGILSTFCVVVVAGVAKEVLEAETGNLLFEAALHGFTYFIFGSVAIMLAAFLFYYQRSTLAYHYGQISLFIAKQTESGVQTATAGQSKEGENDDEESEDEHEPGIVELLDDADAWETWLAYWFALGLLLVGFGNYLACILTAKDDFYWLRENQLTVAFLMFLLAVPFAYFILKSWRNQIKAEKM